MKRKIFVSYKYKDENVYPLGTGNTTARSYVDKLIELFDGEEIYKGEEEEDLSNFKDEKIESLLKDKIYNSTITVVLISPEMKDDANESNQWIPWEISYSLKEVSRNDKKSLTNAVVAVTLPDRKNTYSYYIEDKTCPYCKCISLHTYKLFKILSKNMFNIKKPTFNDCPHHNVNSPVYTGESSYVVSVKWSDFKDDMNLYLDRATKLRESIDNYTIVKEIYDD